MNLGYHLAQRNHRVLLIDTGPQASLTTFIGFWIEAKTLQGRDVSRPYEWIALNCCERSPARTYRF
ncbi:ParA family protein [Altericista sp. CCNU0014]|uniref:ParA family protein n=1 Tax=Altericista sp. CCNU0014 TaxID=3082949 RepID=UPI0038501162